MSPPPQPPIGIHQVQQHFDACGRQFDYIGARMTDMEAQMIDPISFGELRGQVNSLAQQSVELRERQAEINRKLDEVLQQLQEARGAWRGVSWVIGIVAGTLGAVSGWLFDHLIKR